MPADGTSYSRVAVTVLDQNGAPVPDNTEVRLTTSAGDIDPVAYTSGGRAVGILTSSQCPQIAVVSASVNGASASASVEFSSSATYEEATANTRTIRAEGGSLAYCVEKDIVLASGGVILTYKGLTIRAAAAQIIQSSNRILAQGNVTIQRDDQIWGGDPSGTPFLTASAFVCDISTDQISLLDTGGESGVVTYDVSRLTRSAQQTTSLDSKGFVLWGGGASGTPLMVDVDGKNWIMSGKLTMIPGEKILFFKASILVGDVSVLKVPFYSYSYKKRESILHQVRYSSEDGMLVDLPLYYKVSESSTGALKLRYAADGTENGSYARPRKGISFGLDQDYSLGRGGQGRVFLDSVASSSRAIEMAHHLDFGALRLGGQADMSVRYQPTGSYAKNICSATMNVAGSLSAYNYSVMGYLGRSNNLQYLGGAGPQYVNHSYCSLRTVFRPRRQVASGTLGRMSPSLTVGYGNLWTSSMGRRSLSPAIDRATSTTLYQSLGLSFNRRVAGKDRLFTDFDGIAGLTITARGDKGALMRCGPALHSLWNGGSASFGYTINLQKGTNDSISMNSVHQLTSQLFVSSNGFHYNHSASFGLDSGRLSLASTLDYRVRGGGASAPPLARNWRLRCNYNLYSYSFTINNQSYRYNNAYLKVGLYRPLGAYEIGVAWSPYGRDFGMDKSQRFWLELGGRGF